MPSSFSTSHVINMVCLAVQQLNGTLEKMSATLNRNAVYTKASRISRLPAYLAVQYVRFYWKASAKTNAKVLRVLLFASMC